MKKKYGLKSVKNLSTHSLRKTFGRHIYECANENGEMALDIFWEHSDIALVILDIMMPKIDGIEVLGEIRERSDIPVLMLTALGDSSSELACLRSGASDFVSKPFHYEILGERVKNLLQLAKTGHKLAALIGDNLSTESTKTTIELNLAVLKITHEVTRTKKRK